MAEFQYTTVPGKLASLLARLQATGVPTTTTTRWLELLGFRSKNDRGMLGVLKFIGFIDEAGHPTNRWKQYRGPRPRQVVAEGVREGYSGLFEVYPNAWKCTQEELQSFFRLYSTAGTQVVSKTVSTFVALCDLADFEAAPLPTRVVESKPTQIAPEAVRQDEEAELERREPAPPCVPSLHIDIQIHISPDSTSEQIDQIFASMAKHFCKGRALGND